MFAARLGAVRPSRWPPGACKRALFAGTGWGVVIGIGLPVLGFFDCGMICLPDIAMTTAVAIPAGIVAIGPLAAFGRKDAASARAATR